MGLICASYKEEFHIEMDIIFPVGTIINHDKERYCVKEIECYTSDIG